MSENSNQTMRQKLKDKRKKIVEKMTSKKKILVGTFGILVLVIGGASAYFFYSSSKDKNIPDLSMFSPANNGVMGDYVMASGTTSLGYTMDEFEPDYIETELYIEEVYLSSSDKVEAGTAILKVAEASILEAREELKEKEVEADLAYRAGVISYEQSKINAKYTYDAALLEGQYAETVYQSGLKDAEIKVQEARDQVTETEENIEKYKKAFADYYYEYNVDQYKERYEKNQSFYYWLLGEWGFEDKEVSVGGVSNQSQSGTLGGNAGSQNQNAANNPPSQGTVPNTPPTTGGESTTQIPPTTNINENKSEESNKKDEESENQDQGEDQGEKEDETAAVTSITDQVLALFSDSNKTLARVTSSKSLANGRNFVAVANKQDEDYADKLKVLQQMKTNVQNSEKYYHDAWDSYAAAAKEVNSQVSKLEIQIEVLRADLAEAETNYQLEVLEAETAYKKSVAQLELAKSDYNAAIQKAEDELQALEDHKTEAQENVEEFEELLGDGYLYTQNAGTVMMVGVREDSNLQGGGMIVAYRNSQELSVTVYVSQDDINKLGVGDGAQVIVNDYGTYEGKITYLNPISNSDSRTNITYEVLVEVTGDKAGNLKENLTADVIFTTGDNGQ